MLEQQSFYINCEQIGSKIYLREIINGVSNQRKIKFKPKLFVHSGKPSKYKTLEGKNLQRVDFENVRAAKDWLKEFEGTENFEFFGMTRYQYQVIADLYPQEHIEYNTKYIKILYLDIETESENGFAKPDTVLERINLITLKDSQTKDVWVFGVDTWGQYKNSRGDVHYASFDSEEKMLAKFLEKWVELNPHVVTGWWISGFDIPYLVNRIDKVLGEGASVNLSPYGRISETTFNFRGMKNVKSFDIKGVAILDYQRIYSKFTFDPRENWKLDYICDIELQTGKLDHSEYESFTDFYHNDWQKFTDYNIRDVELVEKLESKLKMLELVFQVAYDGKCNFEDVLSQVRVWDCKIYNALKRKGIQIPQLQRREKSKKYDGAFVKEPVPGAYKWVISYDVASLYPNIIRTLNIGPETKIKKIRGIDQWKVLRNDPEFLQAAGEAIANNWTLSANGVFFSKGKISFYSELIAEMFNNRKSYQAKIKEAKKDLEEIENELKKRKP